VGLCFWVIHRAALRLQTETIFDFHTIGGRIAKGIGMIKVRSSSLGNANDTGYFVCIEALPGLPVHCRKLLLLRSTRLSAEGFCLLI